MKAAAAHVVLALFTCRRCPYIAPQQYLCHLRYHLHTHFLRRPQLDIHCSPCPFCGSQDNSNVHRVLFCDAPACVSAPDAPSLHQNQRTLLTNRHCDACLLPDDAEGSVYPPLNRRSHATAFLPAQADRQPLLCSTFFVHSRSLSHTRCMCCTSNTATCPTLLHLPPRCRQGPASRAQRSHAQLG